MGNTVRLQFTSGLVVNLTFQQSCTLSAAHNSIGLRRTPHAMLLACQGHNRCLPQSAHNAITMTAAEGRAWSASISMSVEQVCPQAAALAEMLLAVAAHKWPLTGVATLVPVQVARVSEGTRAEVTLVRPLACVHPGMDAHVAAAAASITTLIALDWPPAVVGVGSELRGPHGPGKHHHGICCTSSASARLAGLSCGLILL